MVAPSPTNSAHAHNNHPLGDMRTLALLVIVASGIRAHRYECSASTHAVCSVGVNVVPLTRALFDGVNDTSACVLCSSEPDRRSSFPGYACWKYTRSCALSENPGAGLLSTLIGPDYTVVFRSQSTNTSDTAPAIVSDAPVLFRGSVNLKLSGNLQSTTCPALVFSHATSVTITNMTIVCESHGLAAVLFTESTALSVVVNRFAMTGLFQNGLFVNGTSASPPGVDLTGSSLVGMTATSKVTRRVYVFVLNRYYGTVTVIMPTPAGIGVVLPVVAPDRASLDGFSQESSATVVNASAYVGKGLSDEVVEIDQSILQSDSVDENHAEIELLCYCLGFLVVANLIMGTNIKARQKRPQGRRPYGAHPL